MGQLIMLNGAFGVGKSMPMTLVRRDYLAEIRSGFLRAGVKVHHVCLTANEATLEARLGARGLDPRSSEGCWVYPRALEACRAHRSDEFAIHIRTDDIGASEVLRAVLERVGMSSDPSIVKDTPPC